MSSEYPAACGGDPLLLLDKLLEQNTNYDFGIKNLENLTTEILKTSKIIQIDRENKADDKYLSIAAASNIAKVDRDRFMTETSKQFPEYEWQQNKGYGTKKHLDAILKYGNNDLLRQSFLKKYL